jgi:conjugative relaxase-like TrwC/TraI family protein
VHTRERVVPMTARVSTLKGADAGLYYVEALPSYYLDAGEPAGHWRGDGALFLGLQGEVDDDAFLKLMAGLDPATGEALGRPYGENSVRGFDVTASAPKSASVLFALGDDATRAAVLDAHDAAVASMVDWIEDHAHTRYRIDGQVATLDAEGIAAACFRQHTSRALDPQLHTHVVIPNRVASDDGRWLALDARTIKFDQRTLSALYHAGLRAELTQSLGVAWEEPVRGIAEMRDVPEEVRSEFSSRTRAVEDRIEEKLERFAEAMERDPTPRERWRLEREAVTDSRPSKSHGDDTASLHREWAERALAIGHEPELVVAAAVSPTGQGRALDAVTRELVVARALDALAESQSTWRPAELVRELAAAVPTDVTVGADALVPWLDQVAGEVIAERMVDLSRPVPDGVPLRCDGRPVTESVADRVLTTPEILAQEERLIAWAERRLGSGGDVALDRAEGIELLTGPQREVASALAGTRDLVLVVGPAGTGKTTAVAPAVEQLRADGRAVFGVAPSAAAAEVLAVDAGLAADTLDKLLIEHRLDRPPDHRYDLPPGSTVVVDEAAMVSTPKLAELAELADDRGWRLALVGDPLQFSAVGRSGMFGHLIDCYGTIELDRVHRFAEDWERDASLRLRRGDTEVLDLYDDHGRLHGGTRRQMEQAVVEAWWEARARGDSVAMMAPTNEIVVDLNLRAQALRVREGEIDPAGPSVGAGHYRLHVGDRLATRQNDRHLHTDRGFMVKNRDQWEVEAVHPGGALTVSGKSGTVRLPADYVAEHVELAYAQTSHANQGRTVDRSFLLLDGPADTRGVYVPMTRGRHSNEAFVVIEGEQTAIDVLAQALARDWIDEPAVARRAELQRSAPGGNARERSADVPLGPSELRELLERQHAITEALSSAERRVGTYGDQIARNTARHEELVEQIVAAEARRDQALQIVNDYDRPIQRRLHRSELEQAQIIFHQSERDINAQTRELADIDGRLPGLRSSLRQAEETLRDRPALDRERHGIGRELERDLAARKSLLGADPPERFVEWLGPRPERGSAERWDDAAARVDQHRTAFEVTSEWSILGPSARSWEPSAFAASQREAAAATERLGRSIGRAHVLERPGLELGIGL